MKLTKEFGHWLAGLIAGEGCFRIHRAKSGQHYACAFRLKLRDDDGPILREIRRKLGFGHVVPMRGYSRNANPLLAWDCESKADCVRLVNVLDRFPLRARKRRDYRIWRKAALYQVAARTLARRWKGPHDWSRMIAYKQAIEAARLYRTGC